MWSSERITCIFNYNYRLFLFSVLLKFIIKEEKNSWRSIDVNHTWNSVEFSGLCNWAWVKPMYCICIILSLDSIIYFSFVWQINGDFFSWKCNSRTRWFRTWAKEKKIFEINRFIIIYKYISQLSKTIATVCICFSFSWNFITLIECNLDWICADLCWVDLNKQTVKQLKQYLSIVCMQQQAQGTVCVGTKQSCSQRSFFHFNTHKSTYKQVSENVHTNKEVNKCTIPSKNWSDSTPNRFAVDFSVVDDCSEYNQWSKEDSVIWTHTLSTQT